MPDEIPQSALEAGARASVMADPETAGLGDEFIRHAVEECMQDPTYIAAAEAIWDAATKPRALLAPTRTREPW